MASSSGKVFAEWVGPFGHALSDGTLLGPGVVVEISKGEADESDNWKAVTRKQADAAAVVVDIPDPEASE